jgi:prephenate dehydrogenase
VAFTSHLPQLASTALAATLDGRPEPQTGVYGPALVDSTRLALSSFDIWGDILTPTASDLLALESYIAKLEEFRQAPGRGCACDATLTLRRVWPSVRPLRARSQARCFR